MLCGLLQIRGERMVSIVLYLHMPAVCCSLAAETVKFLGLLKPKNSGYEGCKYVLCSVHF